MALRAVLMITYSTGGRSWVFPVAALLTRVSASGFHHPQQRAYVASADRFSHTCALCKPTSITSRSIHTHTHTHTHMLVALSLEDSVNENTIMLDVI